MNKPEDTSSPDKPETHSYAAVLAELLFACLPFGVIFLVFAYQGRPAGAYLHAPEWAFASAILFGQTIVKFVQGFAAAGDGNIAERIGLFVAALIVLGLVPSMTVLALILVSTTPQDWLGYAQVGLAVVAAVTFIVFGAVGHSTEKLAHRKR